ncbi:MAG: neutral/alkaline non-lysosomal ceramidase N-terminal domain-containing protein [Deltaproteobacteria bacterium]|nr:neutral/alkaline non-lysosomal ceramidase N-terminal domain-containing protein [Deltaproteobacteria bacterium]
MVPPPPVPAGLSAGAASRYIDFPVGVSLGGYGGRTEALIYHPFGGGPQPPEGKAGRPRPHAHIIPPSIGIYTRPRVQVLALSWAPEDGGEETVVIAHLDAIFPLLALRNRVVERVKEHTGVDLTQNLLLTASHSHQSGAPYWNNFLVSVGGMDAYDEEIFQRFAQSIARAIEDALAARASAKLGVATASSFDPQDLVYKDRRVGNDVLDLVDNQDIARADSNGDLLPDGEPDGLIKDQRLSVFRVDKADASPLAVLFHFGIHGTALEDTNLFMAGDVTEAMELGVEDAIGSRVMVMHVQGAAGDISPTATGFQQIEETSKRVAPIVAGLWKQAVPRATVDGLSMISSIQRQDRQILGYDDPNLGEPWTRWTAPFGQLLCGDGLIPMTGIPDFTDPFVCLTRPAGYHSAIIGNVVSELLLPLLFNNVTVDGHSDDFLRDIVIGSNPEGGPYKKPFLLFDTELSSLRIRGASVVHDGAQAALRDLTIAAVPGEPTTPLSLELRQKLERKVAGSSFHDSWVFGYSQDYLEYILTKEDWLTNGYEMQLQPWGPLWGEWVMNRSVSLARSLTGAETAPPEDQPAYDDPAPLLLTRPVTSRNPGVVRQPETIDRFDAAVLSFIGGDPEIDTPHVVLQRENERGSFDDVRTRGGKVVDEAGLETILVYDYDEKHADTEPHLWSMHWETVADTPAGTYRFRVEGVNYDGSEANANPPYWNGTPYHFESSPFKVRESRALVIDRIELDRDSVSARVTYPASVPDADPNTPDAFRFRPERPESVSTRFEIRSGSGVVVSVEGSLDQGALALPAPLAPGRYELSVLATDGERNTGQTVVTSLDVQ